MKLQQVVDPNRTRSVMDPVILTKLAIFATCAVPACESCLFGRSNKLSPVVSKVKHVPDKECILARDKYEVGNFVSADQLVVRTPGRLPTGYGHECHHNRFHGGNTYNDAASG